MENKNKQLQFNISNAKFNLPSLARASGEYTFVALTILCVYICASKEVQNHYIIHFPKLAIFSLFLVHYIQLATFYFLHRPAEIEKVFPSFFSLCCSKKRGALHLLLYGYLWG